MSVAEKEQKEHQKEPIEEIDETDKGDPQKGKAEDDCAVATKEGVDNVSSIELPRW